jgi:release factor glutamine methyltransferase
MPAGGDSATLVDILGRTTEFLQSRGVGTPRLDAELLLGHVLGLERMQLYLQFDRPVIEAELAALRPLVRRRGQREPLAWITGERGFHDLDLHVHPGVLVPRPDTETLVEAALERIGDPGEEAVYVADVGCGSGAVGLAIAAARPTVRVYATDLSPEALANTKANVARLGLTDRVAVLRGDLLDPIPAQRPVDWVVSNPPYIPSGDIDALMPEVSRHEPRLALDGGADGLDVIRRLDEVAWRRARRGLLVELGQGQADAVADLLRDRGWLDVRSWADLAGIARVVGGVKPASGG